RRIQAQPAGSIERARITAGRAVTALFGGNPFDYRTTGAVGVRVKLHRDKNKRFGTRSVFHTNQRQENKSRQSDEGYNGSDMGFRNPAPRLSLNLAWPTLSAIRTSSASDLARIFCITLPRWTFTVIKLMPISPAICLFMRP